MSILHFQNGLTAIAADKLIKEALSLVLRPGHATSVLWVDSVNGNDANAGSEAAPLASLAGAMDILHDTVPDDDFDGSVIVVKSGHQETLTSSLEIDRGGVKIFGLGSGSSAPRFISNTSDPAIVLSEDNCELNNLYFPAGIKASGSGPRIQVAGANTRIKSCTFQCGAHDSKSLTVIEGGSYTQLESLAFTVTAAGAQNGIEVLPASGRLYGVRISNCAFDGGSFGWGQELGDGYGFALFVTAVRGFVADSITLTNKSHASLAEVGIVSNLAVGADCRLDLDS